MDYLPDNFIAGILYYKPIMLAIYYILMVDIPAQHIVNLLEGLTTSYTRHQTVRGSLGQYHDLYLHICICMLRHQVRWSNPSRWRSVVISPHIVCD